MEPVDSDDEPLKRRFSLRDGPSCSQSKDEPSTSSKYTHMSRPPPDDSDSDSSDDDVPLNTLRRNTVNDGASTSKSPMQPVETPKKLVNENCVRPELHPSDCTCKDNTFEYVRFRQNMNPLVVRRGEAEEQAEARERATYNLEAIAREEQLERDRERERLDPGNQQPRESRPRAHILYVNVGQQLHTVYRLSIHNEPPIFYSFARNSHLRFRPHVGNIFYTPPAPHLDSTALVSDASVRRFGRADVDDINYIHIGPNRQGVAEAGARPNRSNLRILSVTGFRNVTNRSLVHLATAAPNLTLIDFTGTRVTAQGVESFRCLRPDCEVRFSDYVEVENEPDYVDEPDDEPEAEEPGADEPEADEPEGDEPEADEPEADEPRRDEPDDDEESDETDGEGPGFGDYELDEDD